MSAAKGSAPSPPPLAGPAVVRHGLAAGDQGRPERDDWTVPQHWARYSASEHAVWRQLFERQAGLLQGWACEEFLLGLQRLDLAPAQIPDFDRLSELLMRRTGWQVVAVPGLLPDEVFFEHLAHRRFPAGQFIRSAESLDYLEEPDVFHDVFGHVPMLMNPVMADFIQAYGQGGLKAQKLGTLPMLARVYWYTVEFGLVQQSGDLKLLGAGIVSSATESRFSLLDASPHRVHFSLDRVMRTRYRIDDFQEVYFVLRNLDELLRLATLDFAPVYERVSRCTELAPGELQPEDKLWSRGHGGYHSAAKGR